MNRLFSPLEIKNLMLANRLVMPPMALDIATEKGEVTPRLIDHYLQRAPGIGLIIVEHSYVLPEGKAHPKQLGLDDRTLIPGLKSLTEKVHALGTPIGIQITHAGARALHRPKAPSAVHCPQLARFGLSPEQSKEELPEELSLQDLKNIRDAFVQAALRAQEAGFDLLEIHGAHGYLLNEFYSPLSNRRTDQYGGSLMNRLRFPLEVVEAVRKAIPQDLPLFYRLGADDRLPGGTILEDSKSAAPLLKEAGVDCLDLSGGVCGYIKQGPEGFFAYMGREIRPKAGIPVLVTGGIQSVEGAASLIASGAADLVGVGRALLADPAWLQKENVKVKGEMQ